MEVEHVVGNADNEAWKEEKKKVQDYDEEEILSLR